LEERVLLGKREWSYLWKWLDRKLRELQLLVLNSNGHVSVDSQKQTPEREEDEVKFKRGHEAEAWSREKKTNLRVFFKRCQEERRIRQRFIDATQRFHASIHVGQSWNRNQSTHQNQNDRKKQFKFKNREADASEER
jgi:hypothetical protein